MKPVFTVIISLTTILGFILSTKYDFFHLNVVWVGGVAYVAYGILLIVLAPIALGIATFFLSKEKRIPNAFKNCLISFCTMAVTLFIALVLNKINIERSVQQNRAEEIRDLISNGISPDQILQKELGLLEKNRPVTLLNSKENFEPIYVEESKPFSILAYVRNDVIPDNKMVRYEVKGIVKNSVERKILSEGYLRSRGEISKDGRDIFTGEIILNDISSVSMFWLTVEVKGKITESINLQPLKNYKLQ